MVQVTVNIDNKTYHIGCEHDEQEHIIHTAQQLDESIQKLRLKFGNLNHQQLAIISAMLNLNEVSELKKEIAQLKIENAKLINSMINSANTIKAITNKLEAS